MKSTRGENILFEIPLDRNDKINLNQKNTSKNPEVYKLVLSYQGKDFFNKEFQLFYDYGEKDKCITFPVPTKVNVKNKAGKWEKYKSEKHELKKDGKNIGLFFEVL